MHVDVRRRVYVRQCKLPYIDAGHGICENYMLLTVIYCAAIRRRAATDGNNAACQELDLCGMLRPSTYDNAVCV